MRVIVCGGRYFGDAPFMWRTMDWLHRSMPEPGISGVIDGASDDVTGPYMGADYWAHQWAIVRDIPTRRFHAKWSAQGRAAGPLRNAEMLSRGDAEMVVAFPGRRGTLDMLRQAKAAGLFVVDLAEFKVSMLLAISGLLESGLAARTSAAPWRQPPPSDRGGDE